MIKTIGIAVNPYKPGAQELAAMLANELPARGVRVIVADQALQCSIDQPMSFTDKEIEAAEADFLIVLGGDGTMLRWSRLTAQKGTPMFGINYGQYGFITEIQPDEAIKSIESILKGDYIISNRFILKASILRKDSQPESYYALNEVVVGKGPIARMLALNMYISSKHIVTYMADGIIVSTPTGSTAYSLSAGGPVVHPGLEVMVITPICPHTLSERALVISNNETVEIDMDGMEHGQSASVTIDGQHAKPIGIEDTVSICKADFAAQLIQLEPLSFYNKLQTRLHWGERFA